MDVSAFSCFSWVLVAPSFASRRALLALAWVLKYLSLPALFASVTSPWTDLVRSSKDDLISCSFTASSSFFLPTFSLALVFISLTAVFILLSSLIFFTSCSLLSCSWVFSAASLLLAFSDSSHISFASVFHASSSTPLLTSSSSFIPILSSILVACFSFFLAAFSLASLSCASWDDFFLYDAHRSPCMDASATVASLWK